MSRLSRKSLFAALGVLAALGVSFVLAPGGVEARECTSEGQRLAALEALLAEVCSSDAGPREAALVRLEEAVEACVAAQPRRSVTFNEVAGKLADAREALVARLAPKAVWAGQWAGAQAEIWLTRTSAQLAAMAETVARPTAMERRIAKLADDLEAVRAAEVAYDGLSPVVMAALTEGRDTPDAEMINDRVVSEPPGTRTGRMAARSEPVVGTFADDLGLYSVESGFRLAAASTVTEVLAVDEPPRTFVPEPGPAAAPAAAPTEAPVVRKVAVTGHPLDQRVDIDFRDMELSHVVGLLAETAHINVVAAQAVDGMVTARLKNVTLRCAMETVLKLNGLGLLEEDGIYRILPYEEVLSAKQVRQVIQLSHMQAEQVKATLDEVLLGMPESGQITVSTNQETNVLILAGPQELLVELEDLVRQLDVAEPALPTVTEAIKLNYADPTELMAMLGTDFLTKDIGHMAADTRGRHIVVTDVPVKVEQLRALIQELDQPVKQVSIEAMIVDAVLNDSSETGVDWILNAVRRVNTRGETVGNLQELAIETDVTRTSQGEIGQALTVGQLSFALLSGDLDLRALITGEVVSNNAQLLATPMVVTVENEMASIVISEEEPYDEKTSSTTGPVMTSTAFKDIGTVLEVTPQVTHDDHILVDVMAKQSSVSRYATNGVPVEAKREASTSLRARNGQTIYIGGLRRLDELNDVEKVPILGDVPVMNFMFRHNTRTEKCTELLIFMTCNVLPDEAGPLSPELQAKYDLVERVGEKPDTQGDVFDTVLHPNKDRAPIWRRSR